MIWTQDKKSYTLLLHIMTKETNSLAQKKLIIKDRAALPISALAIPMIFEMFFRILVSSVDTIMLSSYSQQAVAGVGLVGQYIFLIQILFNVVGIGTSIVIAQYLGGNRTDESRQVAQASAVMVLIIAMTVTLFILFGSRVLLGFYSIEEEVRHYANTYLLIFGGGGALFMAFSMLQSTILRAYGYTKEAMYIAMIANLINIVGNAISLYAPFGIPVFGVAGVAVSSVVSQIVACILLASQIAKKPDVQFPLRGWKKVPANIYKKVLSIGIPTAGENLAYNISQIVIMAMITTMGTWAMSAHVYTQTIIRFVFVASMSIGSAVQIKTGYYVGAKKPEEAYHRVFKYQIVGTLISLSMIIIINLLKVPIISLFTHNKEIAALTYQVLLVCIYVEVGRSLNLITIPALKGAGDVRFPVLMGIISMWGISVPLSWFLGLKMGLGLFGVWFAIGTDETLRGIVMLFRWKSKRWQTKAIS
ncbi:MAG TPA: MATE family efflux transporter [Treponemataceae bacterium]|nr:MATE family efflux transporter [Treponemataceae bacterium]